MDTTEELHGTYFYGGLNNLSSGELFFWIFLDKVDEYFSGIKDITAVTCILLGQPVLKTRRKPGRTTKGTSLASKFSRRWLDIELPFRLPTFTNTSARLLKPMMVNNLGAFVGRTVPVVGWAIIAYDVSTIAYKTMTTYNYLARKEDKIW
ncbi:STM2901 family protein [Mixta calida]|uniref:STM2901 family protein n=1 Tax=Mixta calida TaxID=665913 RepID=UPI002FDEC9EC